MCYFSLLWTYTTVTWLDTCLITSSVKTFITLSAWATFAGLSTASVLTQQTPPPPSYPARYRRNNSGVNKVAWLKMTDWSTASNAVQLTDRRNSYNCMSGYVTWCTKELSCHDNGHYMLQCTHDAFFVPLGLHGIATDLYYIQVHGIAPRNKPSRLSLSVSVSTIDQLDHISLMIGWIVCMCMYVYIYIYTLQAL